MNRILQFFLVSILVLTSAFSFGQAEKAPSTVESGYTTWTATLVNPDTRPGETTQLIITGKLQDGWHAFGPQLTGEWVSIELNFEQEGNFIEPAGDAIYPAGYVKNVPGFEKPGVWYEGEFSFAIPVRVKMGVIGEGQAQVEVRAQNCDDNSCDRPRRALLGVDFVPPAGDARNDRTMPVLTPAEQPAGYHAPADDVSSENPEVMAKAGGTATSGSETGSDEQPAAPVDDTSKRIADAKNAGLLPFLLLSFAAGLLALATPCVWPMIPITVSYFTKKSEEGPGATLKYALAYCFGIIGTFVGLGLVVTLAFGASGVQKLAASPIANAFLGILFIVLALNLFGLFELQVPTKFVNKVQNKSKVGGLVAPILLGFVFSLTTFTCTVPFVGTILVSATTGDLLYPILGMVAFSLAFAIPFFVLAMIPRALKAMPKSGTWLNAVKAYMGFLELAAALKFISNIDVIVNDPLWLPFAGFAAVWFAIFTVASLYLFGIVKMPHDDGAKIGLGRKIFAGANILIALWILAGISKPAILGSSLAFYPPGQSAEAGGFKWIETYEEGLKIAQAENRPVFINFTGKTCGNCRVMEYQKFPQPNYKVELEKFVLVELFTDRETPEDDANDKLRTEMTKSATNPAYAIVSPDGKVVKVYQGLATSDEDFIKFLKDGYNMASQ
ncbi:MAG: thioredoxin family protein [Fimbriimonadaceae bacterium]|nr:MAG: thioredoxin family protein [Fimbriimonadaceae bacterium]